MPTDDHVKIGALARLADCSVATIRYYEKIGLMRPAVRRAGGHRMFAETDLRRLAFIRRCRALGFAIEQIEELLALAERRDGDCGAARDIARRQLDKVHRRQRELSLLEHDIKQMVEECSAQCAGGPAQDCTILADLAPAGRPCCSARQAAPTAPT
jgi:DNA-binding transcriptional MerR regulator